MKGIKQYITEKYEKKIIIPSYELSVINQALDAYKTNDERKNNQGNGRPSDKQLNDVIKYLDDKKNYKYVGNKYEKEYQIPPYEYSVINQALDAYKTDADRKNNQGNGRPSDKQLDDVIKWFNN